MGIHDHSLRTLGGEPPEGRDLKGFVIEGFTAIMSQGDRTALLAMRGNEEITTRRYDAARRASVAGDVLELIKRSTDFATFIEELVHVIDT